MPPAPSAPSPTGRPAPPDGVVVVLDFGSQFAQLIARRVRELHVYSELLPHDTPLAEIERRGASAMILSGGPELGLRRRCARSPIPRSGAAGIPVLGICYGAQLMASELGGHVQPTPKREYGPATVTIGTEDGLFVGPRPDPAGVDEPRRLDHRAARGLHRDGPDRLHAVRRPRRPIAPPVRDPVPPGGRAHAARPRRPSQLRRRASPAPTRTGRRPASSSRPSRRSAERVDEHARAVGTDGKVICALSGGVDSAVAAALVHRAVGDRLTCIYVDHGLMRKRELELLRVDVRARTWA